MSVNCFTCQNELLTVPCPRCQVCRVPRPERDMPSICGKCYITALPSVPDYAKQEHASGCYKNLELVQKGKAIEGDICVCPLKSI